MQAEIAKPWIAFYEELGIETPDFEDLPVGSYVQTHARVRPNAPALAYFDKVISYSELNTAANQLANALTALGIKRGDVIGLHMPNIPQYAIAIIAISKMGAIGTGLSPLLAPPELAHQIKDGKVKIVISLSDLAGALAKMPEVPPSLKSVIVTGSADFLTRAPFECPDIKGVDVLTYLGLTDPAKETFEQKDVHWNDTFMIQYTGGTTGKPKGAMLSHRNVLHNTAQTTSINEWVEGEETIISAFPMFHIAGLSNALSTARFGGLFVLISNPRDTDFICQQIKAYPPTIMAGVPALYDMMSANPNFAKSEFSQLKTALTGAAPLTRTSYDALSAIIGKGKISDVFGMTETSPCYTGHPPKRYKLGSVGIPMPGVTVRIRDIETGERDMPIGEPGEIVCSGPQVMKGYLNLPEQTAHALREIDGERYMFSGDVGYMDEDGYIFLCDRAKDMLIVGGYKVFSVEVEDKLCALPEVAACAVVGSEDAERPGNDIVHLFVELSAKHKNDNPDSVTEKIIQFCREAMAPYKVPKHVHIIDSIPLTPVGKIDKKALRQTV